MTHPARLIEMIYVAGGDVRLGDEPGQILITDDLDLELRLAVRKQEAAIANHLQAATVEAETIATILDVITGARDVTATQPSTEVVAGFRLIEEWNDTPDPGTADSPYCRCGRIAATGTATPACRLHDRKKGSHGGQRTGVQRKAPLRHSGNALQSDLPA